MKINKRLSTSACWGMVNRIQLGKTPDEILERCHIAETWLVANEVISNDDFDAMMDAIAFMHRESYHM